MPKIQIVDYRPQWREEYLDIAGRIRSLTGDCILRIDHIGSTSVPGLAAKDVIDIQLTVAELEDDTVVTTLRRAGFRLHEKVVSDQLTGLDTGCRDLQKQFFSEANGERRAHLHIRERGRLNQTYPLVFRDYLRADPCVREAYAEIKRQLASRFGSDQQAYYAIKDPYMDTVYQAAKLWGKSCHWFADDDFQ